MGVLQRIAHARNRGVPPTVPPTGAGRLPARLSRHLRPAHHRGGRRGPARGRQPGACPHGRGAVHQGGAIHRAQLPPRARAAAPPAERPQGQRPVHARELGGGTRGYCRTAQSHQRPAGHPALQLRRHHGPGAGRVHGGTLFPPAGRLTAGPHHLRLRRRRGPHAHAGRQGGHEGRALCREPAHPHLGQQFNWQQFALLAPRAGGQAAGRQARVHRSAAQRDGRQMP